VTVGSSIGSPRKVGVRAGSRSVHEPCRGAVLRGCCTCSSSSSTARAVWRK
jgi:hypothetical protein